MPLPPPTAQLVKTVIDQAHLCPLPLSVRPVYWSFDNALRLFPLPDLLILADEYDGYMQTYADCTAVNPGAYKMPSVSPSLSLPSFVCASLRISDARKLVPPTRRSSLLLLLLRHHLHRSLPLRLFISGLPPNRG